MKPFASRPAPGATARLFLAGVSLFIAVCFSTAPLQAGPKNKNDEPKPKRTEAPAVPATPDPAATPVGAAASKDIPFPLPIGDTATIVKVPNVGSAGQILSQMLAMKAKRIDADHVEMQETKIDLNQADGKSDYHIDIPASIFDLKTRIISSEHPVVIRTQDFELTGEKMRFDTVERSGELMGNVHMIIHNLKQTAGVATP